MNTIRCNKNALTSHWLLFLTFYHHPCRYTLSSYSDSASDGQNDGDDILFKLSTVSWDRGTSADKLDHEIKYLKY